MFWNDKTIQLYIDAATYHDFHARVANVICPYLNDTDTLLDLGCGHGFLSIALSKKVKTCICMDKDKRVLSFLDCQGIKNIHTRQGDYLTACLPENDHIIMSFFGHFTENYTWLKEKTKGNIITIKNTVRTVYDVKSQKRLTRETHDDIITFCKCHHLNYKEHRLTLNFGQPFRSMEDVYTYLKRYKPLYKGDYEDYIKRHLNTLEHAEFKYYLAKKKAIGIAIISKGEQQ